MEAEALRLLIRRRPEARSRFPTAGRRVPVRAPAGTVVAVSWRTTPRHTVHPALLGIQHPVRHAELAQVRKQPWMYGVSWCSTAEDRMH